MSAPYVQEKYSENWPYNQEAIFDAKNKGFYVFEKVRYVLWKTPEVKEKIPIAPVDVTVTTN